jgi:hypothetical protein
MMEMLAVMRQTLVLVPVVIVARPVAMPRAETSSVAAALQRAAMMRHLLARPLRA